MKLNLSLSKIPEKKVEEEKNLDQIIPRLFLSDYLAAQNKQLLDKNKIKFILVVGSNLKAHFPEDYNYHTIDVKDEVNEELMLHFPSAHQFIKEGIEKGGVLVHCSQGISRSASVVLSYVMKEEGLTYTEALEKVKAKREVICPNPGFQIQLSLFYDMNYALDPSHPNFNLRKLAWERNRLWWKGQEQAARQLGIPFYELSSAPSSGSKVFSCKNCSNPLFYSSHLFPHPVGLGFFGQALDEDKYCDSYFTQPLEWMKPEVIESQSGSLQCHKCHQQLGNWNWQEINCSCKAPVLPAFQFIKAKVSSS
eukprot:TRINITY_DN8951_c0_g1_i1.p1 TRINITY_DN8951_c0_g1~~TRINITY_DN8951_c0_g1_i1.p1  ORF type:complete len:322 (-),score=82.49 TRINITY_DN8951_c0_g1_i1:78-1001(-)